MFEEKSDLREQRPDVTIGYLTTVYPSISHTFIRREIIQLEKMGFTIKRYSIRSGGELVDKNDHRENSKTIHLLDAPWHEMLVLACRGVVFGRFKLFRGLAMAFKLHKNSERGLIRHLAYLVEAMMLLSLTRVHSVKHLHVHFGTNAAAVALLTKCLGGPTYSMTIHGPDEFDAPIGLSLSDKVSHAQFVVAISHFCAAQIRRWIAPELWPKICLIRCTVEDEWFENFSPVKEESYSLVCVGRLSAQKDHITLLRAFKLAIDRGYSGTLTIIGDGELRVELEDRIARDNLSSAVTLAGWASAREIRTQLTNARALVLPSSAEGLPVVIMEAMALGRPVISTFVAGIPELIEDHKNGWLVPSGDEQALVKAIAVLEKQSIEQLTAMGKAAHDKAYSLHSAASQIPALASQFKMVVSSEQN